MPLSKQLPHSGFCSPHLILRALQLKHPARDFLCDRRVRFGARVRDLVCFRPSPSSWAEREASAEQSQGESELVGVKLSPERLVLFVGLISECCWEEAEIQAAREAGMMES